MIWICALVFWTIFFWGKLLCGKWINLLTIFAGFYAITISLANLRLFDIKAASGKTCIILMLGILAFAVGYTIIIYVYQRKSRKYTHFTPQKTSQFGIEEKYYIREKFLVIMLIFVIGYTLYRLYWTFDLLDSGYSYNQIRTIYFNNNDIFDESIAARYGRSRLDIYVFYPLMYSLIFISCMNFYTDILKISQKKKIYLMFIVFTCVFISAITNGGREIIFYTIFIFVFCYFITYKNKNILGRTKRRLTAKQKRMIFAGIILAGGGMVVLTFMRSSTGENSFESLLKTIYIYFTGYLPNLSARIQYMQSTDYTYGYTFVLGLIKIFAAAIHGIFDIPFSEKYVIADTLTTNLQVRVDIGGGNNFNAYVSPFYYFFVDCGYISLLIESFVFGLFCAITEKKYDTKPNCLNMFMYIFSFYLIISSMVRWEMVHPKTAMILYYLFFIFKNSNKSYIKKREKIKDI